MRATWSIFAICLLAALSGAALAQDAEGSEDPESEEAEVCPCLDVAKWEAIGANASGGGLIEPKTKVGAAFIWPQFADGVIKTTSCEASEPPKLQLNEGAGPPDSLLLAASVDATDAEAPVCQVFIGFTPVFVLPIDPGMVTRCRNELADDCP